MNTKTVYIYKNVDQNKQALIDAFNLALEEELHESPAEYVLVFQMLNWVSELSKPKTPRADKLIKEKSLTCTGTSNVYFAMKYNLKPQGTVAHEFIMFHSAVFGYKRANYLSLEAWKNVYRGDLGTALIDTFTTPSFLRTLTKQQALLLTGYRQDSGDEYAVGNAIIKRLKEFGIDPKSKLLVFSNALDFDKANEIYEYFNGRIKVGFGIGTNITCDPMIDGFKPTNVVMKLVLCRLSDKDPWEKCIKISDDIGKYMGDEKEFEIAIYELHLDKETTKN